MSARRRSPRSPTRRSDALRKVGQEPDPRFTFANERTFLAWNRTALALIGGGLAVYEFVDFDPEELHLLIALPLIILGAITSLTSYRRWERSERALRLDAPLPYSTLPRALAAGIGAIALVACIALIIALVLS